jgi:putative DNA primase/helicase
LYARGLFKEGRDIIPLFKLSLICNKLPRLTSEDQAVWNRVRVLTFESFFPKDSSIVPVDFEEQLRRKIFYRDNSLNEKLPYMKRAFMFMMINKWRKIKLKGRMETPSKVINATDKYRETNDVFLQFIDDCIVEDHDVDSHSGITISDCYNLFKFQLYFLI